MSFTNNIFAQNKINRLQIFPLNRAVFYLNSEPKYTSDLNNTKTQISINFTNTQFADNSKELHNTGIISDIYLQQAGKNTKANIVFKEKRGYTANFLPYSKSLIVEVFKWESLSPAEDSYRNGLLALESGINSEALTHLKKAVQLGHANAASFLGILMLQSGDYNKAQEHLTFAYKNNTNIYDAYAALSQIYRANGDNTKADQFKKLFKDKTAISNIDELQANSDLLNNENNQDPESVLNSLLEDSTSTASDSTSIIDSTAILAAQDSARKAALAMQKSDSLKKKLASQEAPSSINISNFFSYLALFLITIGVVTLLYYIKWRKQQLDVMKKKTKEKFKKDLEDAQQSNIKTASPPKSSGKLLDKTVDDTATEPISKNENNDKVKPNKPKVNEKRIKHLIDKYKVGNTAPPEPIENVVEENNIAKIEDFLSSYIPLKKEIEEIKNLKKEQDQAKKETLERNKFENDLQRFVENKAEAESTNRSPGVELAIKLAGKNKEAKKQTIADLDNIEMPTNDEELVNIAQKLDIQKSGLETKKNLDKLSSDEKYLEKLAKKFGKKE